MMKRNYYTLAGGTQCLQNLNLALGYDEFAGIPI